MQADHVRTGLVLFLLTFFLIFGGLHLYIFIKIKKGVIMGARAQVVLALFLTAMVVAPVAIRLLEGVGYEFSGRLLVYGAYTWTSVALLFICAAALINCYGIIVRMTPALSCKKTLRH